MKTESYKSLQIIHTSIPWCLRVDHYAGWLLVNMRIASLWTKLKYYTSRGVDNLMT